MANERLNTMRGEGGPWPWNPNLLDNWDFGNPVNQRGVIGKITATGYFVDRWKLTSGSVEITANGLILSGTMVQILETDPGVPVTATVLTEAGPKAAQYSANTKTFTVTGTGETLIAAKLELGPVQTLAHKEGGAWVLNRRADPALELLKCRRFYRYEPYKIGYVYYPHVVHIPIDISGMRARPAVTIASIVKPGGSALTITSVSASTPWPGEIVVALSSSNGLTTLGTGVYCANIAMDANL